MNEWECKAKDNRQIIIKHAQTSDAKELHDGFSEVVDEGKWLPTFEPNATVADWVHWINKTKHSREILLIARIDDQYVGHLSLQPEEWMASTHVSRLGIIVLKGFRHIGVGRALMRCAEVSAKDGGFEKIILSTFINNDSAISLYETLGYRRVGTREKHFRMKKGYIDEVLMEKWL
jgi:ribosomal protein S18 acetylase RimI-like enzyme